MDIEQQWISQADYQPTRDSIPENWPLSQQASTAQRVENYRSHNLSILESANPSTHREIRSRPQRTCLDLTDCERHYDTNGGGSIKDILGTIVEDLLSHRVIHDWDTKLFKDPVKDLALFAKQALLKTPLAGGRYMVNLGVVEEVDTNFGVNRRIPVPQDPSQVERQFFPTEVNLLSGYPGYN